ncbi:hypothetical protein NMY22_g8091 [Coprinellus aureogranulatus]|nr:hypothetical protein NMY22_g8091 [Coprinellus aureogranulatus]
MVLPTHSKGLPVFSSQFAFLAIQSLTCRPRSRKKQQPNTAPPSSTEEAQSPTSTVFAIQSLTSRPKREKQATSSPRAPPPPVDKLFLPAELLHIIFTFALEPSSSDIDLEERNFLRATILSCAQVNQQWRLAARDCRALWVHAVDLQSQSLEVIADLLPLSRPHPIDVGHRSAPFRVVSERDLALFDVLKAEANRIREWNLDVPAESRKLRVRKGCVTAFPSRAADQPLVTAVRYQGGLGPLLWDLGELSPNLRKLSIRDPWIFSSLDLARPFRVLTELRVCNIAKHIKPTELGWLQMLQGMSNLQLLALHSSIRHDLSNVAAPLFDIWLPQLRFISLHDDEWIGVSAQRRFWSHLQVPDTCGVELGFPSTSQAGRLQKIVQPLMDRVRRHIRERIVGGFVGMTNLTTADTPQIEISVRSTSTGCQISLGTVRHPDLTLNWNEEQGTSGVMEYLDVHAAMYPKFPPVNIVFNDAAIADVDHIFSLTSDIFWKANSVKIHIDTDTSAVARPCVTHVASALPAILSRMPQINVLKVDKSSSKVLNGLFLLVPSGLVASSSQKQFGGLLSQNYRTVLPNLRRIVLDSDPNETSSERAKRSGEHFQEDEVSRFAEWRKNSGYPVEVMRR